MHWGQLFSTQPLYVLRLSYWLHSHWNSSTYLYTPVPHSLLCIYIRPFSPSHSPHCLIISHWVYLCVGSGLRQCISACCQSSIVYFFKSSSSAPASVCLHQGSSLHVGITPSQHINKPEGTRAMSHGNVKVKCITHIIDKVKYTDLDKCLHRIELDDKILYCLMFARVILCLNHI